MGAKMRNINFVEMKLAGRSPDRDLIKLRMPWITRAATVHSVKAVMRPVYLGDDMSADAPFLEIMGLNGNSFIVHDPPPRLKRSIIGPDLKKLVHYEADAEVGGSVIVLKGHILLNFDVYGIASDDHVCFDIEFVKEHVDRKFPPYRLETAQYYYLKPFEATILKLAQ